MVKIVRETPRSGAAADEQSTVMPAEKKKPPIWTNPIYVWLKSEYLDSATYVRFGSSHAEFEGAGWPLGIQFAVDPLLERVEPDHFRNEIKGAVGREVIWPIIDNTFDIHVRAAWQLPWRYSEVYLDPRGKRSNANFVIRNVGHWNKDPGCYDDVKSLLGQQKPASGGAGTVRQICALTPFCIVSQHWIDDAEHPTFYRIIDTYIVLFYTFETFIQECLALDAFRKGIPQEEIVSAYEHIYCNCTEPETLPFDPATFELAKLTDLRLDWNEIRLTAPWQPTRPQRARRSLFELRLRTHLRVAIAAACHGISAFEERGAASALVQPLNSPPAVDQLAPFWLRHMMGSYDYAAEGDRLLVNLSERYGTKPVFDLPGRLALKPMHPRTGAEGAVVSAYRRIRLTPGEAQARDRMRWASFETSLDDQSILSWQEKLSELP
jgi:hypothetical protein